MPSLSVELVIGWVVVAALIGAIASSRNRGFALGFWTSLLFSPIIGIIVVLLNSDGRGPCPECKEPVIKGAARCPHCRTELEWGA